VPRSFRFLLLSASIAGSLLSTTGGCGKPRASDDPGAALYRTGRTADGSDVASDLDRDALRDRNAKISCASCHGEDRNGGKSLVPDFGPYVAPPLTSSALLAATDRRPAYDRASLARAIVDGIASSGRHLHYPMPRWRISGRDLDALTSFLLSR
jgi:hypothetical protein